ncbi:glycosyltransferase family 4 protein [soil metagenome]
MHIAMIAPPWFPIPPPKYGGIEQVVYNLVEAFAEAGHQVTLFAPEGSSTSAELIPTADVAVGLDMGEAEKVLINEAAGDRAYSIANEIGADIIHDHSDYVYGSAVLAPIMRTVHGPMTDIAVGRYQQMSKSGDRFIAISQRQREIFEQAAVETAGDASSIAFADVIHNPIDATHTPYYSADEKEDYVAFVGRCHWEKGPSHAIEVARDAGVRLKMAMRVSKPERLYFDSVVKPLLEANSDLVEFVGELGGRERDELYGKARALIFSSAWEEPFGLTIVEALAHGTPVAALRRGSATEIINDGVTGRLSGDFAEMARTSRQVMALDPAVCRSEAVARFDRLVIGHRHLELFERVIEERQSTLPRIRLFPVAPALAGSIPSAPLKPMAEPTMLRSADISGSTATGMN